MNEIAERYRKVADGMTKTVRGSAARRMGQPRAVRGVGRRATSSATWWSGYPDSCVQALTSTCPRGPRSTMIPVAAWQILTDGIQRVLEDPQTRAQPVRASACRPSFGGGCNRNILPGRRVDPHVGPGACDRTRRDPRRGRSAPNVRGHRALRRDAACQRSVRTAGRGARTMPMSRRN